MHPKSSKTQAFPVCGFHEICVQILYFLRLTRFKTLQNQQTSYAVYFFGERVAVFLLQKHFKMTPISWK